MTTPSKSSEIRRLHNEGIKKGDIMRVLNAQYGWTLSYQHVFNVLRNPLKGTSTKSGQTPEMEAKMKALIEKCFPTKTIEVEPAE